MMFENISADNLVELFYMIDIGDLSTYENSPLYEDNHRNVDKSYKTFQRTLTNKPFNVNFIKDALELRFSALKQYEVTSDPILTIEEQTLLTFVSSCKKLGVPCDILQPAYQKIKEKVNFSKNLSDDLFVHESNLDIIKICKTLSVEGIFKLWKKIIEHKELRGEKTKFTLENVDFNDSEIKTVEGLKSVLFYYVIRYLEYNGLFNKIFTHHLEDILQEIIDESDDDDEIKSLNACLNILENYSVSNKCPGYCIILCTKTGRQGADMEVEKVRDTFNGLGYYVDEIIDPDEASIDKHISELKSGSAKYDYFDSLVLWVMSHGDEENVYFHNGNKMNRDLLVERFSKIYAFRRKPKMFFLTTCQGQKLMELKKGRLSVETDSIKIDPDRENLSAVYYEMDRVIAYSTIPTKFAFRHTGEGSYYVDFVCKYLKEPKDGTINYILEKVTRKIHSIIFNYTSSDYSNHKSKQASYYTSTLQKRILMPLYSPKH